MIPMVHSHELTQVLAVLETVASRATVDRALKRSGLDRRALGTGPGLLPYEIEADLLNAVSHTLDDRHLGARLARQFDYAAYGAYALYVLRAPNLGAALVRGRDGFAFLHHGSEIVLRQTADHLLVGRSSRLPPSGGRHHLDEGAVLLICDLVRHFLGPNWRPDWVEITGPANGQIAEFEEIVGAPVVAEAPMPSVALRNPDLATLNPDPPPAREAVAYGELPLLMGVERPGTIAEAVRGALFAQLFNADYSEESIAFRLGIGPRTLQRRLKAEGTAFREIKARFLERRARALLSDTALPIDDIADALGFNEPNSFRRAFRGWTGLTPKSYRIVVGNS